MASFNKTIITNNGRSLIAKVLSGDQIKFTKMVSSSRDYTSADLSQLTDLSNVEQTILISSIKKTSDSAVKITGIFSNKDLKTGYKFKTVGLYAIDPDLGEILYSVTTASSVDDMPANTGIGLSSITIGLVTEVSNSNNASLEVSDLATVSVLDFNEFKDNVNSQLNESMQEQSTQNNDISNLQDSVEINTNNITNNTVNINTQKARIDNLVQTSSTSYFEECTSTDTGALLVVDSGATTGQINLASVTPVATGYTPIVGDYVRLVYGVASGSSELIDARIDGLGIGHLTVGDSIRSIFSILKNRYIDLISCNTYEQGRFDATTGAKVDSTTQCRTTKQMQIPTGTTFTAKSKGSQSYIILVWEYSSSGAFVKYTQYIVPTTGITFTVSNPLVNFAFLYGDTFTTASQVSSLFSITLGYNDYTDTINTNLQNQINNIDSDLQSVETQLQNQNDVYGVLNTSWTIGKLMDGTGVETSSSTLIKTDYIATNSIPKLVNFKRNTSNTIYIKCFYYDADKNYTGESTPMADDETLLIDSPYFRIELTGTSSNDSENVTIEILKKTQLYGGKASILGDSISTYSGMIPSDANAFYPAGNITNYKRTYWQMLFNMLGMTLDINNSYSSSTVTSPNTQYTPLSDDTRLSNLGEPDLIIIEGGTNDIYVGKNGGTLNGYNIANLDTTDFSQACTKIIASIQTNHPNAKIIWITPSFIDNTGDYSSRTHCTIDEINTICNAIINVCNYMGVKYFDMRKCGLTMFNFASMTVDHLHWDYAFTKIIARQLYNEIASIWS